MPRLGELAQERKMGPFSTAVFLVIPLIALGSFACGPFLGVFSGRLFASGFNPVHVGGALDQPSLTKWFFLFMYFTAWFLPYVAVARWMSNRNTRLGYWAFAVPSFALWLLLLSLLTIPSYWLIQYVLAMGFTSTRVLGLFCSLFAYVFMFAFLCWAVRKPGSGTPKAGESAVQI